MRNLDRQYDSSTTPGLAAFAGRSCNGQWKVVIEDKEGHGFYSLENNAELYPKMLAFFEKYIGADRAAATASP